ncbi:hypothetical protein GALMADRAFT_254510 [Galerina marginata CBS 339.88]|uniref:Uncharacterized protein n=1 Tax=Galerina marginata (strain CBS 339.88) TaxID=685588 RepID=A0A067SLK2_GALM3|nr:hypothetical protein GALMADRAFT_254510 [Galerina marginata CBS 339.88]
MVAFAKYCAAACTFSLLAICASLFELAIVLHCNSTSAEWRCSLHSEDIITTIQPLPPI